MAWVFTVGTPGRLPSVAQTLMHVCVCRRQNDPIGCSDLPVCSHVHAGGRQTRLTYPSCPVPCRCAKLLIRSSCTHTQQHVVLNVNQTTTQGVQTEGGDGVMGWRREERLKPVSHPNTAMLRNKRQGKADSLLHMVFMRLNVILRQPWKWVWNMRHQLKVVSVFLMAYKWSHLCLVQLHSKHCIYLNFYPQ